MIHPLPHFPPLFPPGNWWRIFLAGRLEGLSEGEAVSRANRQCGLKARDWMRLRLASDSRVSFPVKGGASALKNHEPQTWVMARECDREIPKYTATLSTIYGSRPFFSLLKEGLAVNAVPGDRAESVCRACFLQIKHIILPEEESLLQDLKRELDTPDSRLIEVARDFYARLNPQLSIVDAVAAMGPDAIFSLLPAFNSL